MRTHSLTRFVRRGFTLIEVLIAMLVGAIVLSSAMAFTISTMQNVEGNRTREQLDRNGRFIGQSLERDMQEAGVMIKSTVTFGTVGAWGDTLVILHVPFQPAVAQAYKYNASCGATCVAVDTGTSVAGFELKVGDLARLQRTSEPRLLLITDVAPGGATNAVSFSAAPTLLHQDAGATGLVLDPEYYIQKLLPVIYYLNGDKLMRAEKLKSDGTPDADVIVENVKAFTVHLLFIDGTEAASANGTDAIANNDFDQVVGVRVTAQLAADRVERTVNGDSLLVRNFEWRFSPRNLMYNRNEP